mmetsp:Transcript_9010/g.20949  ORF Transcript_9010/g.20949 Transcript_9010/m.20949 type:complete len:242 (+) Transcript_9010:740-1465(+)
MYLFSNAFPSQRASSLALKSGSASASAASSSATWSSSPLLTLLLGASSPTIFPSSSTPNSARTWAVTSSASSSTSLSSKASARASFRSSSLTFAISFCRWNSIIVFDIFFASMTELAVDRAEVTEPTASMADTCEAMAAACIPTLPSCAFVSYSLAFWFRSCTSCFDWALRAVSVCGLTPGVRARCLISCNICFSCLSISLMSLSICRWFDLTVCFVSFFAALACSLAVGFGLNSLCMARS